MQKTPNATDDVQSNHSTGLDIKGKDLTDFLLYGKERAPFSNKYRDQLISILSNSPKPQHRRWLERIQLCGNCTEIINESTGEITKVVNHCRVRCCFLCQWKRQQKRTREIQLWLPKLLQVKHLNFIFLTLGFKNVPAHLTSDTLSSINRNLTRLTRKENTHWTGLGHVISREFTISGKDEVHFNVHIVVALQHDRFTTQKFLALEYWEREIHKKFPGMSVNVDVRPVGRDSNGNMDGEVIETLSYIAKAQNYVGGPLTTLSLIDQLHRKKMFSVCGLFRNFRKNYFGRIPLKDCLLPPKSQSSSLLIFTPSPELESRLAVGSISFSPLPQKSRRHNWSPR